MLVSDIHFKNLDIEEIDWSSIRENVLQINPLLVEAIDTVHSPKKPAFFKARYPYGAKIVEKGRFFLPLKKRGELLSVQESLTLYKNQ